MLAAHYFEPMNGEQAREIAAWRYDPAYDFHDATSDAEDLAELLVPEKRRGYCAALPGGESVGFWFGRGFGLAFARAGLESARRRFAPANLRLPVAAFSERAVRVYERAGFEKVEVIEHRASGGVHDFLLMARRA